MARTSPTHYIDPSIISITPNANNNPNDLAVWLASDAKIKVFSRRAGIDMVGNEYQEWAITGRNRELADSAKPYTIYARLSTTQKTGYIVFAPKGQYESGAHQGEWYDKYSYITPDDGMCYNYDDGNEKRKDGVEGYFFVKLGEVSLPSGGKRTLNMDTGILGTDQFNVDWALSPDALPLRIELGCTVNDEDLGPAPYVYWGQELLLTAQLIEGWTGTDIQRFDHWEITRDTKDEDADNAWLDRESDHERWERFHNEGKIFLRHSRGVDGYTDDFNGTISAQFTISAYDSRGSVLVTVGISIYAETAEKYELRYSPSAVGYNPQTKQYTPSNGVTVNIRATDQAGKTFFVDFPLFRNSNLHVFYAPVGVVSETELVFPSTATGTAEALLPISVFLAQQSINVRLVRRLDDGEGEYTDVELSNSTIPFLRDGEDSKEREWIYKRLTAYPFPNTETQPAYINQGEVKPDGEASGRETNKQLDDWVPNTWYDRALPAEENSKYVYASYRDWDHSTQQWGDFVTPFLWSNWGVKGMNGDGVQYLYKLFDHELSSAERDSQKPPMTGADKATYNENTGVWECSGWSSEPLAPTSVLPFCYASSIKEINGAWGSFGTLGMWSKWSADGRNGDTPLQAYQWNESADTAPTPLPVNASLGNWSTTAPSRPSGTGEYFLWMTQTIKHVSVNGTATYDTWSAAVRISGNTGTPGEDSKDTEWIYKYNSTGYDGNTGQVNPSGAATSGDTNKNQEGWVPEGWYNHGLGIDTNNPVLYASYRIKPAGRNQAWGAYQTPIIWSHYGRNGMDGDGVEYVFARTTNNIPPQIANNNPHDGTTVSDDGFLPAVTGAKTINGTSIVDAAYATDEPQGTTEQLRYEWVAQRTKDNPDAQGVRTWQGYPLGAMSMWTRYSMDGQDIIVDGATEMKYYVGDSGTTHPSENSSEWKDLSQVTQTPGKYLWSKATTWYRKSDSSEGDHDAGHTVSYNVSYIARNGNNGRGITSITEHYKASTLDGSDAQHSETVPAGTTQDPDWDTNPNVPDQQGHSQWNQTNRYLWNYEKVVYAESDGTSSTERITPQIVAIWTKDGKGIQSIQNKYKLTETETTPSKSDTGWSDTPLVPNSQTPYLWNYETVTYSDGSTPYESDVQLLGHFGDDAHYIYLQGTARDVIQDVATNLDAEVRIDGGNNQMLTPYRWINRGLNMVTINRQTLAVVQRFNYDTWAEAQGNTGATGITDLIAQLNELDDSVFVCLVSYDALGWVRPGYPDGDTELIDTLKNYGMRDLPYTSTGRYPFCFIGYKNLGEGNGFTRMHGLGSYTNYVYFNAYIAKGKITVRDGDDGYDATQTTASRNPALFETNSSGETVTAQRIPLILAMSIRGIAINIRSISWTKSGAADVVVTDSASGTTAATSPIDNINDQSKSMWLYAPANVSGLAGSIQFVLTGDYDGRVYTGYCDLATAANKQGTTGVSGAIVRPCGPWISGHTYVNNDEFIDIAFDSGNYYKLKDGVSSYSETTAPSSATAYWEVAENVDFLATKVFIANSGYSKILGAGELWVGETEQATGVNGWVIGSGKIRHNVSGLELTANGCLNDPDGLHLTVGGKTSVTPNLLFNAYMDELLARMEITEVEEGYTTASARLLASGVTYGSYRMHITGSNTSSTNVAYIRTTWLGSSKINTGIKVPEEGYYSFSLFGDCSFYDSGNLTNVYVELCRSSNPNNMGSGTQIAYIPMQKDSGLTKSLNFYIPADTPYFAYRIVAVVGTGVTNLVINIDAVQLERGNVNTPIHNMSYSASFNESLPAALLPTGIDIKERKMVLTADQFFCQNNEGEMTAYLNELGNFTIAGVLNNLIQSLTRNRYSQFGYFNSATLDYYINPLQCARYLNFDVAGQGTPAEGPIHANPLKIHLPCYRQGMNLPAKTVAPDNTPTSLYTLNELRQMVGKDIIFMPTNLGDVPPNIEGSLLFLSEMAYPKGTGSTDDLKEICDYDEQQFGPQRWQPHEARRTIQRVNRVSFVGGDASYFLHCYCKTGIYNGYECIYWEVEAIQAVVSDPVEVYLALDYIKTDTVFEVYTQLRNGETICTVSDTNLRTIDASPGKYLYIVYPNTYNLTLGSDVPGDELNTTVVTDDGPSGGYFPNMNIIRVQRNNGMPLQGSRTLSMVFTAITP